jgi:hypothetical protein
VILRVLSIDVLFSAGKNKHSSRKFRRQRFS